MTKIGVRTLRIGDDPAFRVWCQGCGHDDFHVPVGPILLPGLPDAINRAELMHRDHLYQDGNRGKRCPIQDFARDSE